MEKSDSVTKKCRKRKRVKLECLVCHTQFDNDYRTIHNKTFHNAMLKENNVIPYEVANAPRNPFEVEKKHMLPKNHQPVRYHLLKVQPFKLCDASS